jgi:hypothetical protein
LRGVTSGGQLQARPGTGVSDPNDPICAGIVFSLGVPGFAVSHHGAAEREARTLGRFGD